MKRSLVTAAAVTLLLAGCATGDTGHLDPEISPDLIGPRSTQEPELGDSDGGGTEEGAGGDTAGDGGAGAETPAPGTSAAPGNDVEAAFADSAGSESWYGEVTAVDVDGDSVLVTTLLTESGADAVAVCEAAIEAAESTGVAEPSVEVRNAEGETLSQRDAAAGDTGCSSAG